MFKKENFRFFITVFSFLLIASSAIVWGSKPNVGNDYPGMPKELSGEINTALKLAYFEEKTINIPEDIFITNKFTKVLGANSENKWIEVDLSEQKMKAWEGGTLVFESLVSTGLPWWPTPTGEFRIWSKVRATKMEGGSGKYYYNLPNVPYVMFFENDSVSGYRGFSLHGTYWHSDFGKVHSHGCVNLPTSIAEKLYYWTDPVMPQGKSYIRTNSDNPGTRVVIHE